MSFDRTSPYFIDDDGLLILNGIWITSGTGAPSHLGNFGDRYFRTDGSVFRNISSPSGTTWQLVNQAGGTGFQIEDYSFHDNNQADISTGSVTYKKMLSMIFRGTTLLGVPSKLQAGIFVSGGGTPSMDIKVFDVTNLMTIAEKTNVTNTVETITDLGTLSNLPTGLALFEVQLRAPVGIAHVSTLGWDWP